MCGDSFPNAKELLSHIKLHKRQHLPAMNFLWWLGKHLHIYIWYVEEVDGLDSFQTINEPNKGNILYIDRTLYSAYYDMYKVYLKGTCRNIPCLQCIKKNMIRTMPEKKYMNYKMQQNGMYEPDKPRSLNPPNELLIA